MHPHDSHDECLICFSKLQLSGNVVNFFAPHDVLCHACRNKLLPLKRMIDLQGLKVEALYWYNETFSKILIQYKELHDEALAEVLLHPFEKMVKKTYQGCVLAPIPSSQTSYEDRGFDHVARLFERTGLPVVHPFVKTSGHEQKTASVRVRSTMDRHIAFKERGFFEKRRIVLIDDVMTTGSSMLACHRLLKERNMDVIGLTLGCHPKLIPNKHHRRQKLINWF